MKGVINALKGGLRMANLEDLNLPSISDMSPDEAIEYLRQLRLSRRTPNKKSKKSVATKTRIKQAKSAKKLTQSDAKALLALLGNN